MHYNNKIFIIPELKISDIIISNPSLILMLEHLDINMEVQEKTVKQICRENNINIELFLTIANLFNGLKSSFISEYPFNDILIIINYLKNSHQYYLQEKYPEIQNYIENIYQINNHPEILMIEKFFYDYFKEVSEHLDYENKVVFPYVLELKNKLSNKKYDKTKINYSVLEYKEQHNDIEEKLTDIKNLLIKYLPIRNDQQIRRKLLFSLFELEYDLMIHTQIEDNILIPLVEKMEHLTKKENE
jgi:regulator of cell morphogenesis and NO signaling